MARTARQQQASRQNGKNGGRPTTMLSELKRRARERAMRRIAREQDRSVEFLVYVRDNANAPWAERVRCAMTLLDRGELPSHSRIAGTFSSGDADVETPKLFVLGKHGPARDPLVLPQPQNGNGTTSEVDDESNGHHAAGNGDGAPTQ